MATPRRYVHALAATLIAGALTYVFLGTVSRSLDDSSFDTFSVYWSLSLIIGFGLFLPIEQELSRLSASAVDPVAAGRAALRVGAELALYAVAAIGLASPLLVSLGAEPELLVIVAAFVLVSAVQFVARGALLAAGRVGFYANVLIADSVLRVLIAGALALAVQVVAPGAGGFALGLLAAILIAHVVPLWFLRRGAPTDPTARAEVRSEVRTAVFGLVAGTLAAQLLLNAGPILIDSFGAEEGAAGAFQATFSVARIPLFVLVPMQGLIVAPLAALVARGATRQMTALMLRIAGAIAALMLIGGVVGYLVGPWIIELVFGEGRSLEPLDVALLIGGVLAHCGLILCTQALVASRRHRRATIAWVSAAAAFAAVFAIALPTFGAVDAAVAAFLIGSVVGWILAVAELVSLGRRSAAGGHDVEPSR